MRSAKELLTASKQFNCENKLRSWLEVMATILPIVIIQPVVFISAVPTVVQVLASLLCGLLYVRLFVVYHDYQHRAILSNSKVANWLMTFVGIYVLAPENIWRRSHDHHHNHNSKLSMSGIGAYPTICKKTFLKLPKSKQRLYLINRHPLTILLGYLTLFIYWLNLKSFIESPRKHVDSLVSLVFHFAVGGVVLYFFGVKTLLLGWCTPFFIAFSMGAYLFYAQHNFPGVIFCENHEWAYDQAALKSTSKMVMSPVMNWFTGNIGYHHVHHLNSRIPFYRLKEAMNSMPELESVPTTSWNPIDIVNCLRLKLWDPEKGRMITLQELHQEAH